MTDRQLITYQHDSTIHKIESTKRTLEIVAEESAHLKKLEAQAGEQIKEEISRRRLTAARELTFAAPRELTLTAPRESTFSSDFEVYYDSAQFCNSGDELKLPAPSPTPYSPAKMRSSTKKRAPLKEVDKNPSPAKMRASSKKRASLKEVNKNPSPPTKKLSRASAADWADKQLPERAGAGSIKTPATCAATRRSIRKR